MTRLALVVERLREDEPDEEPDDDRDEEPPPPVNHLFIRDHTLMYLSSYLNNRLNAFATRLDAVEAALLATALFDVVPPDDARDL